MNLGQMDLYTMFMHWWEKDGYYQLLWRCYEYPKRTIWSWWNYKVMRRDNAKIIAIETKQHRNELVLDYDGTLVKLLGWADIEEKHGDFVGSDYYWILQHRDGKVSCLTCVGGPTWLRGRLPAFDYECLRRDWRAGNECRNAKTIQQLQEMNIKIL